MLLALGLTVLAGLATVLGGLAGTHTALLKGRSLALALGFSAGAMIYVSFMDLLPEGQAALSAAGHTGGVWTSSCAFLAGLLGVIAVDKIVPHAPAAYEVEDALEPVGTAQKRGRLLRSGMLVAAALALHHFPEGIATFFGALHSPTLGVSLAVAIALHNIPEGVAVAAPVYAATGSRFRALGFTAAAGLAAPVGALAGYFLLAHFLTDSLLGIIFCAVAGMMVYISINELLPAARQFESGPRQTTSGFIAGMAIMLVGLNLLAVQPGAGK